MSTNTTTTKARRKIVKRIAFSPRLQKKYSRKDLKEEVLRLTGEDHDPGYLADIANGTRKNNRLEPAIRQAVSSLEAKAA